MIAPNNPASLVDLYEYEKRLCGQPMIISYWGRDFALVHLYHCYSPSCPVCREMAIDMRLVYLEPLYQLVTGPVIRMEVPIHRWTDFRNFIQGEGCQGRYTRLLTNLSTFRVHFVGGNKNTFLANQGITYSNLGRFVARPKQGEIAKLMGIAPYTLTRKLNGSRGWKPGEKERYDELIADIPAPEILPPHLALRRLVEDMQRIPVGHTKHWKILTGRGWGSVDRRSLIGNIDLPAQALPAIMGEFGLDFQRGGPSEFPKYARIPLGKDSEYYQSLLGAVKTEGKEIKGKWTIPSLPVYSQLPDRVESPYALF